MKDNRNSSNSEGKSYLYNYMFIGLYKAKYIREDSVLIKLNGDHPSSTLPRVLLNLLTRCCKFAAVLRPVKCLGGDADADAAAARTHCLAKTVYFQFVVDNFQANFSPSGSKFRARLYASRRGDLESFDREGEH